MNTLGPILLGSIAHATCFAVIAVACLPGLAALQPGGGLADGGLKSRDHGTGLTDRAWPLAPVVDFRSGRIRTINRNLRPGKR